LKPRFERAPINPEFLKHIQRREKGEDEGAMTSRYGYIPHPVTLSHLKGKKLFIRARSEGLPSSYDLRKQGRVTSVKDQGPAGICWAFATYGSLESCLLPGEYYNFSENNMKNLLAEECPEGYDRPFDGGGNIWMSTAYLARWSGPVLAEDDPYDPASGNCNQYEVKKHLKQVIYIPDRVDSLDNTNLKLAIMNSGAVSTVMGFDEGYYNEKTASYYSTGGFPNHAVCLVGWNDNYSPSKFNTAPPGKGAFIVKNSWGTGWGDNGYFYISYYDMWVGIENALFSKVESPDKFKVIHQYDPLGWIASFGYRKNTAWFANIFTAKTQEALGGVAFYTAAPESSYTLYIYRDVKKGNPRSGTQVKKISGIVEEPSYFTKYFASPVTLKKEQRFAVVVKLTTPGYNYPVPCQINIPGLSSKAHSEPGWGYVSDNGKQWTDIYSIEANASICLKGLAN